MSEEQGGLSEIERLRKSLDDLEAAERKAYRAYQLETECQRLHEENERLKAVVELVAGHAPPNLGQEEFFYLPVSTVKRARATLEEPETGGRS